MIDTFFNILRKTLVATITVVFAFVILYTPQHFGNKHTVPPAEAFIVTDPAHTAVSTAGFAFQAGLVVKETILDGLAWAIAKTIVSSLVASLVDWINSGFKGSPAFITDLKRHLLEAADQAAGIFIESLGDVGSFLCSPYKLNIQIALAQQYRNDREDKPYEGCTLTGVIDNLEEFIDGNFKEGGWKDWITITSEPERYTNYGQLLEAQKGLQRNILNAKNEETKQIDWGSGFLSGKVCKKITTPDGKEVEKCSISKPGATISASLSKALGAGQDTLITADEIDEIIGALIGQLAQKAITGAAGLLGLSANTGFTYTDYESGSYTGDLLDESSGDDGAGKGIAMLYDGLKVQTDIKTLADSAIPSLQSYLANPKLDAEKRTSAQNALTQAREVQQKAPGYATIIQDLITDYEALEKDYDETQSPSKRSEIRQNQMELVSTFIDTESYTAGELKAAEASWKTSNF